MRAVAVTVAAAGLVIGVLAALPQGKSHAVTTTTTTTLPSHSTTTTTGGTTTTTTAQAARQIQVAVLAPAGSTLVASVEDKLTAAHDRLVPEGAIPPDWVSSLTAPEVEYPPGLAAAAGKVAVTLGKSASSITPEQAGSSKGADIVEVFVPAT